MRSTNQDIIGSISPATALRSLSVHPTSRPTSTRQPNQRSEQSKPTLSSDRVNDRSGDHQALRLVGDAKAKLTPRPNVIEPIREGADPRWVLALRVSQSLEGATLAPEKRERLLQVGRILGLSLFDANLVIAIIQDRARRGLGNGLSPATYAQSAVPQLEMVPLPRSGISRQEKSARRWRIATIVACLITAEMLIFATIFG